MNRHDDLKFIEHTQIYDIRISEAMNDTVNQNVITVTFRQSIATKSDNGSTYFGEIRHRFPAKSFEDAINKIKQTATAYHNPKV